MWHGGGSRGRLGPFLSIDTGGDGGEAGREGAFGLAGDEVAAGAEEAFEFVPELAGGGGLEVHGHVAAEDEVPVAGLGAGEDVAVRIG